MHIPFKLLIIVAILGIADTFFVLARSAGFNFGTLLPGVLGALILIGLWPGKLLLSKIPAKQKSIAGKVVLGLFCVWFISFVLIEGLIIVNSRSEASARVDTLLVLGAGLKGEQLSLALAERMETCLEYAKAHPDTLIIVSGGQGQGETISEAEAMKRFLIGRGIDGKRVIKEEASTSTMENLFFTKQILDKQNGSVRHSLLIITSDFHLMRTKMLAKRNGLDAYGIPSRTPWFILPNCYLREYAAVIKSFVFDR